MTDEELQRTILLDLAKHLDQKIMTAIEDFAERCGDADIDMRAAAVQILTTVGHHTAMAAHALNAQEPEFLSVCYHLYHKDKKCLTAAKKRASR